MFGQKEKRKKKEFEKIYDSHVECIFRFTYLKVNSRDDAEDITSKVFLRVWKSFQKENDLLEGGEEKLIKNPRAFLYRVTRNLIIDYYRKNRFREDEDEEEKRDTERKKKRVPLEDVVLVDKNMRADEKAMLESQMQEVKDALQNINEDYQNVIIWYYLDELTTAEIADLLEKPESSVRVLIHRAVASLRKELESKK